MMGPRKLSEIRDQLRNALSRGQVDPIERLEECVATSGTDAAKAGAGDEVVRSLQRILESHGTASHRDRVSVHK